MQLVRSAEKQTMKTTDLVYGGLFCALMVVGAFLHIVIPIGPSGVTISLQIFFAVLAGFFLGARRGCLAVLVYLILGLAGLPIYAHGGGLAYMLKPTYGFLIGFAAAAFVTGFIKERLKKQSLAGLVVAAIAGEMVYYLAGLVYYYLMMNVVLPDGGIGIVSLLSVWFFSTVIPDGVICVAAAVTAWQLLPQLGELMGR